MGVHGIIYKNFLFNPCVWNTPKKSVQLIKVYFHPRKLLGEKLIEYLQGRLVPTGKRLCSKSQSYWLNKDDMRTWLRSVIISSLENMWVTKLRELPWVALMMWLQFKASIVSLWLWVHIWLHIELLMELTNLGSLKCCPKRWKNKNV